MENDVKYNETKTVEESIEVFSKIGDHLETYREIGSDGKIAFELTDNKALAMWKKHIKPLSDAIKPLQDDLLALDEKRAEYERDVKAHLEKMDAVKSQMDALLLKRNKFITRISPIIIREYQSKLNKYQQFGSVIEDNGKVFVTVQDKLAAFLNGYKKLLEKHEERVTKKISPKIMAE